MQRPDIEQSSHQALPPTSVKAAGATPLRGTPSRMALVLPLNRLGDWHRQLVETLCRTRDVDVFLDDRARPYPLALRLWLRFERLALGGARIAPVTLGQTWRPASELDPSRAQTVIDLSEHATPRANAIAIYYGDIPDSCALVRQLLAQQSPVLTVRRGQLDVLASSRLAIEDKFAVSRGLQGAFARCLLLVERGLQADAGVIDPAQPTPEPQQGSLLRFIPLMVARKLTASILNPFRRREHWHVALRDGAGAFKVVQDDGERYYADPFLHVWQGRTFLFVEEYPYGTGRGIISAAEVTGDEIVTAPVPVLARPYHLSYPFVFEHGGDIYMMPESGENRAIELYRAVEFPWKWETSAVLMQGAIFSDATAVFHDAAWWLFVTTAPVGGSTQDELSIFYSDTLFGAWSAHPANPVKSDSRGARPAGRVVQQDGRLFRPAQDCEASYGAGLVWYEIVELSPERFIEREVVAWDGQAELGTDGLHTFDQSGALQAIDFKRNVGRGRWRRPVTAIAPASDGKMNTSFSPISHQLQFVAPR